MALRWTWCVRQLARPAAPGCRAAWKRLPTRAMYPLCAGGAPAHPPTWSAVTHGPPAHLYRLHRPAVQDIVMSGGEVVYANVVDNWPTYEPWFQVGGPC